MSKHIVNGWLMYKPATKYSEAAVSFVAFDPTNLSTNVFGVPVREHSFEVEIPDDFDPRPAQVAALEAEKQKLRADLARSVADIDDRISKLLALTMEAQPS